MPRDKNYNVGVSSIESINDPFVDFYPLDSQEFIFSKSLSLLRRKETINNIIELNKKKRELNIDKFDSPIFVTEEEYNNLYGKKMAYDASSFYHAARNYNTLAKSAPFDLSPVLYYYGFMFMHSSLINLIYRVVSKSQSHGLSIIWPKAIKEDSSSLSDKSINDFLNNVAVKVDISGAFARFRDLYTILGMNSIFSLITKSISDSTFISNPSNLLTDKPLTLSLPAILNYQYDKIGYDKDIHDLPSSEILLDYLCLFIISSIARYRPTIWRLVYSGKGEILPDILKVYRNIPASIMIFHEILVKHDFLIDQNTI